LVTDASRLLILADDFTGACDAAAAFAAARGTLVVHGLPVQWPADADEVEVLGVDLDLRERSNAEAEALTRETARQLCLANPQTLVSLKIDSTLRGPIAGLVAGALTGSARHIAVIAPAFPEQGRLLRDGRVVVDGQPGANLTHALDMEGTSVLGTDEASSAEEVEVAVAHARARGIRYVVVDADRVECLRSVAEAWRRHAGEWLLVGSAGLARQVAASLARSAGDESSHPETQVSSAPTSSPDTSSYLARPVTPSGPDTSSSLARPVTISGPDTSSSLARPVTISGPDTSSSLARPVSASGRARPDSSSFRHSPGSRGAAGEASQGSGPVLVVAGSPAPATLGQIEPLRRLGAIVLVSPDTPVSPPPKGEEGVLVLCTTPATERDSGDCSRAVAEAAAAWAAEFTPTAIVLAGGATARLVCERVGAHGVRLHGELEPGIPFGYLVGGVWNGVRVVTKAGGFGSPTTLLDVVHALGVSSVAERTHD
jgi:uncharacterized protein YgbK (DUF1537 family)